MRLFTQILNGIIIAIFVLLSAWFMIAVWAQVGRLHRREVAVNLEEERERFEEVADEFGWDDFERLSIWNLYLETRAMEHLPVEEQDRRNAALGAAVSKAGFGDGPLW